MAHFTSRTRWEWLKWQMPLVGQVWMVHCTPKPLTYIIMVYKGALWEFKHYLVLTNFHLMENNLYGNPLAQNLHNLYFAKQKQKRQTPRIWMRTALAGLFLMRNWWLTSNQIQIIITQILTMSLFRFFKIFHTLQVQSAAGEQPGTSVASRELHMKIKCDPMFLCHC